MKGLSHTEILRWIIRRVKWRKVQDSNLLTLARGLRLAAGHDANSVNLPWWRAKESNLLGSLSDCVTDSPVSITV